MIRPLHRHLCPNRRLILGTKKALGTIAGTPYLVQLPAFHARLICPPKKDSIEVKEATFVLILFFARFILGTLKITMGTILGTILCGFVRNMQADSGTKSPQLRGLMGYFAEGLGLRRNARYFPIQNRPKISPNRSSGENSPVIEPSEIWARRNSSAKSSS